MLFSRVPCPVPEVEGEGDSISSLCTQIASAFSGPPEDPFSQAPMPRPASSPQSPVAPPGAQPGTGPSFPPAVAANSPALPPPLPARDTNPWAKTPSPHCQAGQHTSAHPGKDWSIEIDLEASGPLVFGYYCGCSVSMD
uniref:Uncharacterized protein n=1 Tax=Hucho hucho TaxID=62062 RepID=A0A4W5QWR4_9TELE